MTMRCAKCGNDTDVGPGGMCPACMTLAGDPRRRIGHPRYYELMEKAMAIHAAKNSDYATGSDPLSNFRECEKAGVTAEDGCYTRLSDKWCRVQNLLRKERTGGSPAVDESIEDTLLDAVNYCAILIVLREERKAKKS